MLHTCLPSGGENEQQQFSVAPALLPLLMLDEGIMATCWNLVGGL